MGSKYDKYWIEQLPKIKILIEEAFKTGHSRKLDVSKIQKYGNRQYWGTRVTIPPNTTKITEELSPDAHGKSLGNIIIHSGILKTAEKPYSQKFQKEKENYIYILKHSKQQNTKKFQSKHKYKKKQRKKPTKPD